MGRWTRTGASTALAAMLAAGLGATLGGCGGGTSVELSEAGERGRSVYMNVCVACHGGDPSQDGALAPSLTGTSRELLEWRVVRGAYPPGYTPKRPSGAMPAFPHLADQLDDLYAFIRESTGDAAPE